jgi:hypothetical protein
MDVNTLTFSSYRRKAFMPIIKIQVLDGSDQPLAASVQVTGCGELSTNAQGLVQVLLGGDASDAEIQINGAKVWSGPQTTLKPMEVFKLKGDAYQRQ